MYATFQAAGLLPAPRLLSAARLRRLIPMAFELGFEVPGSQEPVNRKFGASVGQVAAWRPPRVAAAEPSSVLVRRVRPVRFGVFLLVSSAR